jgi:hypothetical protein
MLVSRDCSKMSEKAFASLLHETVMTPMDPSRGPLYQYHVFHRPAGEDVLLTRAHALVMDGASIVFALALPILLAGWHNEWHEALRRALSYGDFADWQSRFMATPKGRTQLLYWKRKLSDPGRPLALPYDHERTSSVPACCGALPIALDRDTVMGLRRIARAERVSLFSVLMTVFTLLLRPYATGQGLLIGTTASGRTRFDLEHTLGPLSNTVAVRAPVDSSVSGLDLLAAISDDLSESLSNQDYPAEAIRGELALDDQAGFAVNQVSFSMLLPHSDIALGLLELFANLPGVKIQLGENKVETVVLPPRGARRDLSVLVVLEDADRVILRFDYDSGRFDEQTIKTLAARYRQIAGAFSQDPTVRCDELVRVRSAAALV